MTFTRRKFLATTTAVSALTLMPNAPTQAAARYTRYNAASPQGKAMLKSYAVAIKKMLALPPEHPHNWFRNAFVHLMDCPHGNWWFYVWHRGYVGFFEQTVRELSGNANFAFPYWDWTTQPQIPAEMFDGVLTPSDADFRRYTQSIETFTTAMKPTMEKYFNGLNKEQRLQLDARGYTRFDLLWNDVTGFDPMTGKVVPANSAFATTDKARYLTRTNPKLDAKTAKACSPDMIAAGIAPIQFYDVDVTKSFTSTKTASHNTMPGATTQFSVLEGNPHNKVHNYIGGVGPWDPGPYGSMTNFLSPVDPVFFLHHSNMDRLWDVWTRKQQKNNLPYLPTDKAELDQLVKEPFLQFVRADGTYETNGKAGDYLSTERFNYDYAPVAGEDKLLLSSAQPKSEVQATIAGGVGSVSLQSATGSTIVTITVARPADPSVREFDVLINAPAGVTQADVDSPYYAGTISFFGPPMAGMTHDVTFALPLNLTQKSGLLKAEKGSTKLEVRLVSSHDTKSAVAEIKAFSVHAQ